MRKFRQFTVPEFSNYISSVPVKRNINHIQIHHTWKPRKADYRGESTIRGMWQYHTQTNGWQDIAQHFSIAPDGTIWDGRSLDVTPAGIAGYNAGGLMFEIIGDFDIGQDKLDNSQLFAVARAIIACQDRFKLKNANIVFHREYNAAKSCPGTSIERYSFLNVIDRERKAMQQPKEKLPVIERRIKGFYNDETEPMEFYIINGVTYNPTRSLIEGKMGVPVHFKGDECRINNRIWK